MRKLKLFLLLAVAAGSIYSLTACKDDDKNKPCDPAEIIGTWKIGNENGYTSYTFDADGSYTWITEKYGYGSDTEDGTYTFDGRNLILRSENCEYYTFEVSISGNEMILTESGDRFCYTRQ